MTKISIHQPVYLPWLGFFEKILASEIFVFLDDVQYEKNGWQNRNKIRTSEGEMWLTIPVHNHKGLNLNEIKIQNNSNWINKHTKSIIQNYSKSEFFNNFWQDFELIYEKQYDRLIDVNIDFIKLLMEKLGIKTKTIFSSELKIEKMGSERILEICKKLKADSYISGIGGKNYLNMDDFKKNDIIVEFQNFQHPEYRQRCEPFIPNMAAIDLLFNEGNDAIKFLKRK